MDVHIRLLGPVEAVVGDAIVDLRGAQQRRLLAKLALRPGVVADGADLIDAIWPDGDLPADARETLRTYASRLRASLGGTGTVAGRAGGYALVLAPGAVDGHQFETLLSDAASSAGAERLAFLNDALLLWRGPALAGFDHEDWARPTASRWTELRETAVDDRAELLIELGRHEEAVAALESASHERPLRERTHRLLMAALQLGGRQGEALRAGVVHRDVKPAPPWRAGPPMCRSVANSSPSSMPWSTATRPDPPRPEVRSPRPAVAQRSQTRPLCWPTSR